MIIPFGARPISPSKASTRSKEPTQQILQSFVNITSQLQLAFYKPYINSCQNVPRPCEYIEQHLPSSGVVGSNEHQPNFVCRETMIAKAFYYHNLQNVTSYIIQEESVTGKFHILR